MRENSIFSLDEMEAGRKYWLDKLSGELQEVRLPGDFDRTREYRQETLTFSLPSDLSSRIFSLSKNQDMLLYVVLLSAFKVLIYKLTDQEDIVVAAPLYTTTGEHYDYNRLIYIRDRLIRDMTFKDLLSSVKLSLVDGYKNQHYRINKVLEELGVDPGEISLARVLLMLEHIHKTEIVREIVASADNDITLSFAKTDELVRASVRFNSAYFKKETVEEMCSRFVFLLNQAVADINLNLGMLEIMTVEERNHLLHNFYKTETSELEGLNIHRLFEQQAERTPNRTAVREFIDMADIFDELNSTGIGKNMVDKFGQCCFKKNPYLFKRNLDNSGGNSSFILIKTHRHNCVIVNGNMDRLLSLFDGSRNIDSIFSELQRKKPTFLLYEIRMDDILEISYGIGEKAELTVFRRIEDWLPLVKLAFRNHLIELKGLETKKPEAAVLSAEEFDVDGAPVNREFLEKMFTHRSSISGGDVLFLGDTVGMASTGILYMAAYLRRNGFKAYAQFNDFNRDYVTLKRNVEELLERIRPAVVAVSMKWFLYIARVIDICEIVKAFDLRMKVVIGGNTASLYGQDLIQFPCIDYVVRGDGELPLLHICRGEADGKIPNILYKKAGKIMVNEIDYVQDTGNTSEIYLSHLDEILLSPTAPLFGSFFIYTHKGCLKNCCYCGGCRQAMKKIFNRSRLLNRGIEEVRKDIFETWPYSSTFMFDFDAPNDRLLGYLKKLWEGIDFSSHFCIYCNTTLPDPEIMTFINSRFLYVYYELDLASLSERHRNELYKAGLVKYQPRDEEILSYFSEADKYENTETRMNLVAGLPYFTTEDIEESQSMVTRILENHANFNALHWARLHAQPGSSLVETAGQFDMRANAVTFQDFLRYSRESFDKRAAYNSGVETFHYPYIYYNKVEFNSKVSSFYSQTRIQIEQFKESEERKLRLSRDVSYRELDRRADLIAHRLRERGAGSNRIVALLADSSVDQAVGILAILKAGAAYLPINPEYPAEAARHIMADSQAMLLLTDQHNSAAPVTRLASTPVEVIQDNGSRSKQDRDLPEYSSDLAYVIYTSGTTGRARGVLVNHKGLANFILWRCDAYGYTADDVTLQLLSYNFDGFCTNFYSSLLSGGSLVLVPDSRKLDFDFVKEIVRTTGVTNTSLVPGIYDALLTACTPEDLRSFRFVVLAGEKTGAYLIRKSLTMGPHIKLINEYGPTEASVTAAAAVGMEAHRNTVIGIPIANTSIYILNRALEPVPIGAAGEICIAGAGVARGYLNMPHKTAGKFIPNPFIQGEAMYRTGDSGRWLREGEIEILGRLDQQVKIRGNRIELGEIEYHLVNHEKIEEAVVILSESKEERRKNGESGQYLSAFIVSAAELETATLRNYLSARLPDFMIPSYFMNIESLPLTVNGKIDRRALQKLEIETEAGYESPETPVQKILAEIWQQVLGVEQIGLNDNFFALGGDSIKVIQIAARLRTFRLRLEVKDIFLYPTIKRLEKCIEPMDTEVDQGAVEGEVQLTPVQRWFFKQKFSHSHHFNQSVAVFRKEGFQPQLIEQVFTRLARHHDALRMIYTFEEGRVIQRNRGLEGRFFHLEIADLTEVETVHLQQEIRERADRLQRGLSLSEGLLMRLGLFRTGGGDYLVIVVHHLVIDGVSWRILLEDFNEGYRQALKGEPVAIPAKTESFKQWALKLKTYADSEAALREANYWAAVTAGNVDKLKRDHEIGEEEKTFKNRGRVVMGLDEVETGSLLTEVHQAYNTEINDILLTALALSLNEWAGMERWLVNLEGHGRESILEGVDISRTVGWFTSQYPVLLDVKRDEKLSYRIKQVKETLRRIPNRGIGWGILAYLTTEARRPGIRFDIEPEISFNYLGEFGRKSSSATSVAARDTDSRQSVFELSDMNMGDNVSPECEVRYALDVVGGIYSGKFRLTFLYNKREYRRQGMDKLAGIYRSRLLEIIRHCTRQQEAEPTPSDLGDGDLSLEELRQIEEMISQ